MAQPATPVDPCVLVVEDDKHLLYLACKQLREAGYEPIGATDGVEAVRAMVENPDCRQMVTDYVLPSFGGDTWIRFLERFCGDWSIVVMSGEDVDPGVFISMPKPASFENIIHHLERVQS